MWGPHCLGLNKLQGVRVVCLDGVQKVMIAQPCDRQKQGVENQQNLFCIPSTKWNYDSSHKHDAGTCSRRMLVGVPVTPQRQPDPLQNADQCCAPAKCGRSCSRCRCSLTSSLALRLEACMACSVCCVLDCSSSSGTMLNRSRSSCSSALRTQGWPVLACRDKSFWWGHVLRCATAHLLAEIPELRSRLGPTATQAPLEHLQDKGSEHMGGAARPPPRSDVWGRQPQTLQCSL